MDLAASDWKTRIVSLRVSRICVDFGVSMDLLGDEVASSVNIGTSFKLITSQGMIYDYATDNLAEFDPILNLRQQVIAQAQINNDNGELALIFDGGDKIIINADDQFEAWAIVSNNGLRLICMPGGEVAIWNPNI